MQKLYKMSKMRKLGVLILSCILFHLLTMHAIGAVVPAQAWDGTGVVLWGYDLNNGTYRPISTKIDAAGNTGIVTFVAVDPNAGALPVSVVAAVSILPDPNALALKVSVVAGVAGVSVTASQGSPWTVSGSVSIQAPTTGQTVNVSNTVNALAVINAPTTGQTVNVSNTVTVGTHAVTQGSPWTVSGSVSIQSATTGLAVNISNTPAVTINSATTGLAVNISNTTLAVTQASPWTISGSAQAIPATTGGLTTFHLVGAATTNATSIKASAGQVYGWHVWNNHASSPRKLAFHNTAGTPTAGASIFFTVVVPPQNQSELHLAEGIAFSTGIGITTVTGLADNDATAIAAQGLIIEIFYK